MAFGTGFEFLFGELLGVISVVLHCGCRIKKNHIFNYLLQPPHCHQWVCEEAMSESPMLKFHVPRKGSVIIHRHMAKYSVCVRGM